MPGPAIGPARTELARIGGHRLRVTEADERHHRKAQRVDVCGGIERQPPGLLRGVIAVKLRGNCVTEFVKGQGNDDRHKDDREQRDLAVHQQAEHERYDSKSPEREPSRKHCHIQT
jgi:hypothetical protein